MARFIILKVKVSLLSILFNEILFFPFFESFIFLNLSILFNEIPLDSYLLASHISDLSILFNEIQN